MVIYDGLLSFSFQALLLILFLPFVGAFVGEVDIDDLEADLIFAVLFL